MKGLHSMNKLRVAFVRDGLINTGVIPEKQINSPESLKGVTILDVGCGGKLCNSCYSYLFIRTTFGSLPKTEKKKHVL